MCTACLKTCLAACVKQFRRLRDLDLYSEPGLWSEHEKDGKAYLERVRGSEQGFEHRTKCEDFEYGCFSRQPCTFFVSLAAAPLSHTHQPRRGLHKVVATFWLSVFASVFAPVS